MKKFLLAAFSGSVIAIAGCAHATGGAGASEADAAIATAKEKLAEVKKAGFEWRIIDKSTGKKSESLDKVLAAAEKAKKSGDDAEAIRIAKHVTFAAEGGLRQAADPGKVWYAPK